MEGIANISQSFFYKPVMPLPSISMIRGLTLKSQWQSLNLVENNAVASCSDKNGDETSLCSVISSSIEKHTEN